MKLTESRVGNVDIYHLEGQIDLHYAPVLRALFQTKVRQRCPALLVELSGVRFIDSSGIAALLEYLRDASSFAGQFCLAAPDDTLRYVFEVVQLQRALPIFVSAAEALEAMQSNQEAVLRESLFEPEVPPAAPLHPAATRLEPDLVSP